MHCVICGNELNGCVCPDCGFDLSRCGELYPSLAPTAPDRTALWVRRRACYRELNQKIRRLTERVEELEKRPAVSGPQQPAPRQPDPRQPEPVRLTKKWECECGCRNSLSVRYCTNCGRIMPAVRRDAAKANAAAAAPFIRSVSPENAAAEKWECDCGCRNPVALRYCKNCGRTKPV